MTGSRRNEYKWVSRGALVRLWAVVLTALFAILIYPVGTGVFRLFVVLSLPVLWLSAMFLLRGRRKMVIALLVAGIMPVVFSVLPGRPIDPDRLRTEYILQLKTYAGARYVWGGENGFGIDCSGLVRRALINAHARIALATANPKALRIALDLWWHDCSALALSDQYRDFTVRVVTADSINSLTGSPPLPGDIAVTTNGLHVLAYLGNREWIQADPGAMRVIRLTAPHENVWFKQSVHIMRWTFIK